MFFLLMFSAGFGFALLFTYLSTFKRFSRSARTVLEFLGYVSLIHVFVGFLGGSFYMIGDCEYFWSPLILGYLLTLVLMVTLD